MRCFSNFILWLVYILFFVFGACQSKPDSSKKRPSFTSVQGIKFIEVRREFDTGLSFSEQGFQQSPEWTLYFLPGDSVKIYSPEKQDYIVYPIYFDHGQVVNFAREWLRVIQLGKDSLRFQLLEVQSREVKKELSTVYMQFYSEEFLRRTGRSAEQLKKPRRSDSLFIQRLITRANTFSKEPDSLFAAREPVEMQRASTDIRVERGQSSRDDLDFSPSDEYLYPEFDIHITNAYKDFKYNFTVLVDRSGKLTVGRFATLEKEFEASRRKVLQGIVDVYLQRMLKIKPGTTLGMAHASEIMLHVSGEKP